MGTANRKAHVEVSPKSGTQAVEKKAANVPTDDTGAPKAHVSFDAMATYLRACSQVLIHQTLQFVVAGAACYLLNQLSGGKRGDVEEKLKALVSEQGVKRSQQYEMLGTSWTLALRIGTTGTKAFKTAAGMRQLMLTATTPEEATALLIGALKQDYGVESFNRLKILCELESEYTPAAIAAEAEAAQAKNTAAAKTARTRKANDTVVSKVLETPALLQRALIKAADHDDDTAIKAIVIGINRMTARDQLVTLRDAVEARLNALGPVNEQAPVKGEGKTEAKNAVLN